jgi:Fic family protein
VTTVSVNENPSRIEPCSIEGLPTALGNVVADVISQGSALGNRVHPQSASGLSRLVALMNCYYSNLIEGHHTRPRDIERALDNEFDADPKRRDLQIEARSHITVQREIEIALAEGRLSDPTAPEFLREIHKKFYQDVPPSFLQLKRSDGFELGMIPGEFRSKSEHDIVVGRHHPPSSLVVADFVDYFHQRFRSSSMGTAEKVIAIAVAHHRFNFIHPFLDGNGRVSRLMSHAMALKAGIGAHGLWSISRGLARGLEDRSDYMRMMNRADAPRENDTDGRGNLSTRALIEFVTWFLQVALDQIRFMQKIFDLDALSLRLEEYVGRDLRIKSDSAGRVVAEIFRRGTISRGEATRLLGPSERAGRTLLRQLLDGGILKSDTPKGEVYLHFSSPSAATLFPQLFPAEV